MPAARPSAPRRCPRGDVDSSSIAVDELTRDQALAGRPEWMPEPVLEAFLDVAAASVGVLPAVTNTVERVTGHPSRPFREWATAHRAAFA